ncbi:unnamed protein product [Ectocarpus sp. CCAP 1310/34]|nr:unnamed protein product [Ectocarpus sp. CCAP 1310/34]
MGNCCTVATGHSICVLRRPLLDWFFLSLTAAAP